MRVVCDQCAASYKVPNARLTKPINKATCKSCGAKLLIPKPPPNADDDERVVVAAVPAGGGGGGGGAAGAYGAMAEGGVVNPGVEDDDDKTVPVISRPKVADAFGSEDDVLTGAPISTDDRERIQAAKAPAITARGGRPLPVVAAPNPFGGPAAASSPAAPAPAPATPPSNGLAVAGILLGVLGGGLIAVAGGSPMLLFFGTLLAASGLLTAMLTLLFPDQQGMATGGGAVVGLLLALMVGLVSGRSAEPPPAQDLAAPAPPAAPAAPSDGLVIGNPVDAVPAEPTAPPAEPDAPAAPQEAKPTAPATTAPTPAAPPAEPKPATPSEPKPAPVVAPTPAPKPAVTPTPAPTPAPAPKPATVSREIITTIVSSNVGVKRCFFDALKSGEIVKPVTVNTSFYLSAGGRASNVRVTSPSSAASGALARCLDSAFQTMTFPPSSEGQSVSFPFRL